MKHLRYLRYLIRHKWFVFVECWEAGLYWRGLIHDWSKFSPDEWFPYAEFFYGSEPLRTLSAELDSRFDFAWLLHQKRNRHHWQFWLLPEDDGGVKVLPIREPYLTEMLCDWKGTGKAQGKPETLNWYLANRANIQLHPTTRREVEHRLGLQPSDSILPASSPVLTLR